MNNRPIIPGDFVNWSCKNNHYFGCVIGQTMSPVIEVQVLFCNSKQLKQVHVVEIACLEICK